MGEFVLEVDCWKTFYFFSGKLGKKMMK